MTTLRQAAQRALEALGNSWTEPGNKQYELEKEAITALRTALEWPLIKNILDEYGLDAISFVAEWKAAQQQAEPVQKLVAWGVFDGNLHDMFFTEEEAQEMVRLKGDGSIVKPLYTAPPKRPWAGLTPEEVKHLYPYGRSVWGRETFEAIEKALKEKNT